MDLSASRHERVLWWTVVAIASAPTVARVVLPGLADDAAFASVQRLGLGMILAVGVGATIVDMRTGCGAPPPAKPLADPVRLYAIQKLVATLLGILVLLPLGVWAARSGRFADSGGWLLLPMVLIGPVLYARDLILRRARTRPLSRC